MDIRQIDPRQQARTLLDEFKAFAFKGSVIDLAVGVIIGAAFGKIVTSLVANIIMPVIGLILPAQRSYENWKATYRGQEIRYGLFFTDVVNFLIVAAALFLFIVKFLGWIIRHKNEAKAAPPLTKDQELLSEIRDLLKQRAGDAGTPGA